MQDMPDEVCRIQGSNPVTNTDRENSQLRTTTRSVANMTGAVSGNRSNQSYSVINIQTKTNNFVKSPKSSMNERYNDGKSMISRDAVSRGTFSRAGRPKVV